MALFHELVTLYASATKQLNFSASAVPDYCQGITISVQNLSGANYVYLGTDTTSSVSFGFRLSPGQSISYDLDPSDNLHATCNDNSTQVAVTRLTWQ